MPSWNTYRLAWVSLNLGFVVSLHDCSSKAQSPLLGLAWGRGVTPFSRCPWPLAVLAPLSLHPWRWTLGSSSPPCFCMVSRSQRVHLVKSMGFPVIMYGCESRTIKKTECWSIDAFKLLCWRRLESSLDSKEIQTVYCKENYFWIFTGKTDVEAETPILWPPDVKNWLILRNPDAGKDWRWEEKGTTEDETVRWHHWLIGYEFE